MIDLKRFEERLEAATSARAERVAQETAAQEAEARANGAACAARLKALMKERLGLDVEPACGCLAIPEHEIEFYVESGDRLVAAWTQNAEIGAWVKDWDSLLDLRERIETEREWQREYGREKAPAFPRCYDVVEVDDLNRLKAEGRRFRLLTSVMWESEGVALMCIEFLDVDDAEAA